VITAAVYDIQSGDGAVDWNLPAQQRLTAVDAPEQGGVGVASST
jgi:hypothetical protein